MGFVLSHWSFSIICCTATDTSTVSITRKILLREESWCDFVFSYAVASNTFFSPEQCFSNCGLCILITRDFSKDGRFLVPLNLPQIHCLKGDLGKCIFTRSSGESYVRTMAIDPWCPKWNTHDSLVGYGKKIEGVWFLFFLFPFLRMLHNILI